MAETTWVAANEKVAGRRVALWDRHPAHPNGEVFVAAASGPVEVAKTPGVLQALHDKRIVEIAEPPAPVQEAVVEATAPAPPPAPTWFNPTTMNADELKQALTLVQDPVLLTGIRAMEEAGPKRKTALTAIDARIQELQAGGEPTPPTE